MASSEHGGRDAQVAHLARSELLAPDRKRTLVPHPPRLLPERVLVDGKQLGGH